MKPRAIVAPDFRTMDEIFDGPTLERLHDLVEVVWGRDGPMPQEAFEAALTDATAVVFGSWHYGPVALSKAGSNLRHVFEVAGGHHHQDLDYAQCFERNITVASCAPAFGPAVAEMAVALALSSARLVTEGDAAFRAGREEWLHAGTVGATTIFGKTVGFVGAGTLSKWIQHLLAPFDVRFVAHDPWLHPADLEARGIAPVGLPELFSTSDLVFVLAVPTPQNRHLVSRELLERLRPEAILTLVSRAHLVDFDALTDLVSQRRFRAAIDVFPREPLEKDHPIRRAPGTVLSAHRAGAIPEALLDIGRMVVDDLEVLLAGEPPSRMQYATPKLIARFRSEAER